MRPLEPTDCARNGLGPVSRGGNIEKWRVGLTLQRRPCMELGLRVCVAGPSRVSPDIPNDVGAARLAGPGITVSSVATVDCAVLWTGGLYGECRCKRRLLRIAPLESCESVETSFPATDSADKGATCRTIFW